MRYLTAGWPAPAGMLAARSPAPVCVDASTSPWVALKTFNCGTWYGKGVVYDRTDLTHAPPGVVSFTHTVCDTGTPLELTTSTQIDGFDAPVMHPLRVSSTTDVDLDGSFSDEHAGGRGLLHAMALLEAAHGRSTDAATELVLEHTLAISDTERWRCLLVYGEELPPDEDAADAVPSDSDDSILRQLVLLTERRLEASASPLDLAAPSLDALVGTWVGDACARAPKATQLPGVSDLQLFGDVATNVYNARLQYATRELWDGNLVVSRSLQYTSFGGEQMAPITTSGSLASGAGADGLHTVAFGGADPTVMFLLPGGAHVVAPTRISAARPFATEFCALLAPGESFGWESYALQEALDDGALPAVQSTAGGLSQGVFPTTASDDADAINRGVSAGNGAPRLARVQRLYSGRDAFVSGTTSLLSIVGGAKQKN